MRHNIGHSNVNVGVKIQTDNKDLKIWRKNSSYTMGLPMLGIKPYLSSKNCDLSNRSSIQNYQISSSVSNEFGHKLWNIECSRSVFFDKGLGGSIWNALPSIFFVAQYMGSNHFWRSIPICKIIKLSQGINSVVCI